MRTITLVLSIIVGCIISDGNASAASVPMDWGFVNVNVTCKKEGGKSVRQKYVSLVFTRCQPELSSDQIVQGAVHELGIATDANCKGTADISYEYFTSYDTEAQAIARRTQELQSQSYKEHFIFGYAWVGYTTKCK